MLLFPTVDEDYQHFVAEGYNGSINDMHYQALGDIGYTGSYTDRLHAHLTLTYGDYHQALYDLRTGVSTFSLLGYSIGGVEPDLVLNFAADYYRTGGVVSTFNDSLTYTGASSKTMVDSDGLLKWAPHNIQTYSNDFTNAIYGKTRATVTGDKLEMDATDATNHNWQTTLPIQVIGAQYTATIELKADELTKARWWTRNETGVQVGAYFDLSAVTINNDSSSGATIEDIGSGWYRCTVPFAVPTSDTNTSFMQLSLVDTDGTVTIATATEGAGIRMRNARYYRSDLGGMVDNPDRSDSYVPTTSAAVYLPRRGHHIYNGSTWVNEGIQIESEERTNLLTYSEDFSDASWTASADGVITVDSIAAPDGQTTADTLGDDSTGGTGTVSIRYTVPGLSTTSKYTVSVFAKAKQLTWMSIGLLTFTTPANSFGFFDLGNGVEGTHDAGVDSSSMENYGNGWYRCSITFTTDAVDTQGQVYLYAADGQGDRTVDIDGTSDIYIYGAQFELGSTPSSYIPTAGATVTRSAETLTVAAANLPYSATNMSMQMDGELNYAETGTAGSASGGGGDAVFYLWKIGSGNYIEAYLATNQADDLIAAAQETSGSGRDIVNSTFTAAPGINTDYNISTRHGATVVNIARNGTAETANETPTAIADFSATNMQLGYIYMGTIGKFRMWDADLGDTGIAEAST